MAHNHVYGICESKCQVDVYSKERIDEMTQGIVTMEIIESTLENVYGFNDGSEIACYGGDPLVFIKNTTWAPDSYWAGGTGIGARVYKTKKWFVKGDVIKLYIGTADVGDRIDAYVFWGDELTDTIDLKKDCVYLDSHIIDSESTGQTIELAVTRDAIGYLLIRVIPDTATGEDQGVIQINSIRYFAATSAKVQLKHGDTNLEFEAGGGVGQTTEGKTWEIDGTTYTGGVGSEIFNNYAYNKAVGEYSHAEGIGTTAMGNYSHAEGQATTASGEQGAHAEGGFTTASGTYSHAEGYQTIASGGYSHAEGGMTTASNGYAHAEGFAATASGECSHAEGAGTTAEGNYSHAEGDNTTASGECSHAEGVGTTAEGNYSHAEGYKTESKGYASHAEGYMTIAANVEGQHAMGKYNVEDTSGKYALIIGNGKSATERSNAFAVGWDGKIYINNSETGIDLTDLLSRIEALENA